MARWLWQVIVAGTKGLCSMSKLDLQSTEDGASGAQSSKGKDCREIRLWAGNGSRHFCGYSHLQKGWWCHSCIILTHAYPQLGLPRRAMGGDKSSSAWQTTESESVRRTTSVARLGLPMDTLSVRTGWAGSCSMTLMRKQRSWHLYLGLSGWWEMSKLQTSVIEATKSIIFCYKNPNTLTLYQSGKGKSIAQGDNTLHPQEWCDQPKEKISHAVDNVMWKKWIAHMSLVETESDIASVENSSQFA